MCVNSNSGGVTGLFKMYSDLLRLINRDSQSPYWNCKSLHSLTLKIETLKKVGKIVFKPFQASGMATQKWHLLDRLSVHVQKVGGLNFFLGELHDWSNRVVRSLYAKRSTNKRPAINEIVEMHARDSGTDFTKIAFYNTCESKNFSRT